MRHRVFGKKLSRTSSHRKAMLRNLAASLIEHGTVRTTQAKAKLVRPFVEKLITTARRGDLHARRRVIALLQDRSMVDEQGEPAEKTVVTRLFDEIAPRYVNRSGGYTRIIHLSERRIGDSGSQVLIQLIEQDTTAAAESPATQSRRKRRAAKRHQAAAAGGSQDQAQPSDQGMQDQQSQDVADQVEPQQDGEPSDAQPEQSE